MVERHLVTLFKFRRVGELRGHLNRFIRSSVPGLNRLTGTFLGVADLAGGFSIPFPVTRHTIAMISDLERRWRDLTDRRFLRVAGNAGWIGGMGGGEVVADPASPRHLGHVGMAGMIEV